MSQKWKWKKSLSILFTSIIAILPLSACTDFYTNNSKTIVITVDGPQAKMYQYIEKEFNKTPSHLNHGFNLKFLNRDVFGAIDLVSTLGFADQNTPDFIYAPQDRVTTLLQTRSIIPFDTLGSDFRKDFFEATKASEQEQEALLKFGAIIHPITNREILYALPHNREGIVGISSKSIEQVRKDMNQNQTNNSSNLSNMQALSQNGQGIFRIQDFWYGSGILGGILNEREMQSILYRNDDTQSWSSGFIKSDKNYNSFAKAVDVAAKIIYQPWKDAYKNSTKGTFQNKNITSGDLKAMLGSDMNVVNNKVFELLQKKSLDYAIIGSWDINNAVRQGINTFFNIENTSNTSQYLQSNGSWSMNLNARNITASPERKIALQEFIKLFFSQKAYYEYFKEDSKVPFYKALQQDVSAEAVNDNALQNKDLNIFLKETGYSSFADLDNAYIEKLKPTNDILDQTFDKETWEKTSSMTPMDSANELTPTKPTFKDELFPNISEKLKEEYTNMELKPYYSLRNVVAEILGLDDVSNLKGTTGESWQVGDTLIKEGETWPVELQQDSNNAHIRKIEKEIWLQNGDSAGDKEAILQMVMDDASSTLSKMKEQGKTFSKKYAKTNVDESKVENAVEKYYNIILNAAVWTKFVNEYKKVFEQAFFPRGDSKDDTTTNSSKTNIQVLETINNFKKTQTFSVILELITSQKEITNDSGLGVLKFQANRIDNNNPQFGAVWSLWNNQVFGNPIFHEELARDNSITNEDIFAQKIKDKLNELFVQRTRALDVIRTIDFIQLD